MRRHVYYTPYYEREHLPNSTPPEVFNKFGEKLSVFFLADVECALSPYDFGSPRSRCILWDRYNFGLKTHFYTHDEAFNTVGKPDRRFAVLAESRAIRPRDYTKYIREKSYIENEFEAVFTFDDEILDSFKNAKFLPFSASYWFDISQSNTPKTKNISMLASAKRMCEMHTVRKNLAFKCKRDGLADTFGTFDGGSYAVLEDTLRDYRFSIVVENDITQLYFTEKITNCFASKTIPVYLGASRIGDYFNADGIIQISLKDIDNIEAVLSQCTPEEYERRLPAVLDNFERVKEYENMNDYLYRKYLQE